MRENRTRKAQSPEYRRAALDRSLKKLAEAGGKRVCLRLEKDAVAAMEYLQGKFDQTSTFIVNEALVALAQDKGYLSRAK